MDDAISDLRISIKIEGDELVVELVKFYAFDESGHRGYIDEASIKLTDLAAALQRVALAEKP
jgi:hypothetical protein